MSLTSKVFSVWKRIGCFFVDHFAVIEGKVGSVHRHLYCCDLRIEEVPGSGDQDAADDFGRNGQTLPFSLTMDLVNATLLSKWNNKLILPCNSDVEFNEATKVVCYKGSVLREVMHRYAQLLERRWEEEVDEDGFTLNSYYRLDRWSTNFEAEKSEGEEEAERFLKNQVCSQFKSTLEKWEQITDRSRFELLNDLEKAWFDLPFSIRSSCAKVKRLKLGESGTTEEIAREVLLDIIEELLKASGKGLGALQNSVYTFTIQLEECESCKEGNFSAGYSVTGRTAEIIGEWRKLTGEV